MEGSYFLYIQIINDTFNTSFNLFDNYSKYVYTPSSVQVTLNKKKFKANDYIIAQIAYNAIGKLQAVERSSDDSAFFNGMKKVTPKLILGLILVFFLNSCKKGDILEHRDMPKHPPTEDGMVAGKPDNGLKADVR
ncbi:hypothetical protein A3860_37070 [Niastella vici]|uniref:Uncharacterized protein n=2 Tax=Niastella vici TaxID=1703345 RepID=A0A1V9FMM1_9BACT|nr:hypothetical protein A3860_37070 [Niastella vici]